MNTLVVNCSDPSYNLGAAKLANWLRAQGDHVTVGGGEMGLLARGFDRVCLSVIFSWHVDRAIDTALAVKDHAEVWIGGPAMNHNHERFSAETGIAVPFVQRGEKRIYGAPDARFDKQRGDYRMVYAMRGCPVGCSFCPVWQIEGKEFVLDRGFEPAKMLCDNNLSGPDVEMQDFIIRRYEESGVPLMDANSGFEPKTFDAGTFARWSRVLRGAWRFALDETEEMEDVRRMMGLLRGVSGRKKRVYCLLGYEPVAQCLERARKIIEWGGEPFCQVFIPLNYPHNPEKIPPPARYDWATPRMPYDMRRYFNSPQIWRTTPLWEYKPRINDPPPFAAIAA